MKYLIVDDNDEFRIYLREFITTQNDECFELNDGRFVTSVYKEFLPDWVLLDILMKDVNGFEAAEKLKHEFPEARFAMVSNYCDDKFRRKAKIVGAAALISKENLFELNELIHGSKTKT